MHTEPYNFVKQLTKAKFDQMTASLVERAINCAKSALKNAKLKVSDIDEVILVGGSTRIPLIQESVEKFFNKKPNKSVNPDEVEGFLEKLDIKKFYGIGKVTAEKMYHLGIFTGYDLKQKTVEFLEKHFSNSGQYFYQICI